MSLSSSYEIVFDQQAEKDIKHLWKANPKIFYKIRETIDNLCREPFCGKSLKGEKKGCYSVRQGTFRIIYEVYIDERVIHIIRVSHRKDVYR